MEELFEALVAPTRRLILDELAEHNGQTLFELCSRLTMKHELSITRQGVSQHLQVLEEAGLVKSRRSGRYKYHDFDPRPLKSIQDRWPITLLEGENT